MLYIAFELLLLFAIGLMFIIVVKFCKELFGARDQLVAAVQNIWEKKANRDPAASGKNKKIC